MSKQNISMGNVNMSNSSLNISQNSTSGEQTSNIHTQSDYVNELERLIKLIGPYQHTETQVADIMNDLTEAVTEIKKSNPKPSAIRRLLNDATVLLNDVKDLISPGVGIALSLKGLIEILPQIFK